MMKPKEGSKVPSVRKVQEERQSDAERAMRYQDVVEFKEQVADAWREATRPIVGGR